MKKTIKLKFKFPQAAYVSLKLFCVEKGISIKDFTTDLLLRAVDRAEDHRLAKKARKRIREQDDKDIVSFEEACKEAGWVKI